MQKPLTDAVHAEHKKAGSERHALEQSEPA